MVTDSLTGQISNGWHEEGNDYTPFITYFLGIILNSYNDFEKRLGAVYGKSTSYDIVKEAVSEQLGRFIKTNILELCPSLKSSSAEAALKNLKEETYMIMQGGGRSTSYVRNHEISGSR